MRFSGGGGDGASGVTREAEIQQRVQETTDSKRRTIDADVGGTEVADQNHAGQHRADLQAGTIQQQPQRVLPEKSQHLVAMLGKSAPATVPQAAGSTHRERRLGAVVSHCFLLRHDLTSSPLNPRGPEQERETQGGPKLTIIIQITGVQHTDRYDHNEAEHQIPK